MNNEFEEKRLTKKYLRKRLNQLRNAQQKEPNNIEINVSILRCLIFLGRFDEAFKESIKVLEIEPENHIALWAMGSVYSKQGNFNKGEEYFRNAVELHPEFMVGYLDLGAALISQNNIEDGIIEINKGVRLNPSFWRAHLNLCNAYLMQKHLKDGFNEAKLAWKYHKSFRTFTNLMAAYDFVSRFWSYYSALALNVLAIFFPSPFTLLLLILGSGRLSISAFGIIFYGNKKIGGYIIYAWIIFMILLFILRYDKAF